MVKIFCVLNFHLSTTPMKISYQQKFPKLQYVHNTGTFTVELLQVTQHLAKQCLQCVYVYVYNFGK